MGEWMDGYITILATTYANYKQYLKTSWNGERMGIHCSSYWLITSLSLQS